MSKIKRAILKTRSGRFRCDTTDLIVQSCNVRNAFDSESGFFPPMFLFIVILNPTNDKTKCVIFFARSTDIIITI